MPTQTPQAYFKSLQTLHLALVAGLVLITVVLFFFGGEDDSVSAEKDWLIYIPPAVGIFALIIHKWLFSRRLAAAKMLSELDEKLTMYRAALVLRWALLEGPALICILIGWMTQTSMLYFLGMFFALLLYLYKPSKEATIQDMELSIEEIRKLQDENNLLNIREGGIT